MRCSTLLLPLLLVSCAVPQLLDREPLDLHHAGHRVRGLGLVSHDAFPVSQLPAHVDALRGVLTLHADFTDIHGEVITCYLVNRTSEHVVVPLQDGDAYVKCEVATAEGWQRAQSHAYSMCGNSYMLDARIEPGHFLRIGAYYPRRGEPATICYRTYDSPVNLISNQGPGRLPPGAVEEARRDEMALRTADFETLAAIARGGDPGAFRGGLVGPRATATFSLSRWSDDPRLPPLLMELLRDSDEYSRRELLSMLAEAAPEELSKMLDDRDHRLRKAILAAGLRHPLLTAHYERLLDDYDDPDYRLIVRAYAHIAGHDADDSSFWLAEMEGGDHDELLAQRYAILRRLHLLSLTESAPARAREIARETLRRVAPKLMPKAIEYPAWFQYALESEGADSLRTRTELRLHRNADDQDLAFAMFMPKLAKIHLGDECTDRGIGVLRGLADLRYLNLHSAKVTAEGIRQLVGLPLTTLVISGAQVSDASLAHIGRIDTLTMLVISGAQCSAEGLRHVARLPRLKQLHVVRRKGPVLDDRGVAHIGTIRTLRMLCLTTNGASEEGLAPLGQLTALHTLNIGGSAFNDRSLRHLRTLEKLVYLLPGHCVLTAKGLQQLAHLPSLKVMNIGTTGLTRVQIQAFNRRFDEKGR